MTTGAVQGTGRLRPAYASTRRVSAQPTTAPTHREHDEQARARGGHRRTTRRDVVAPAYVVAATSRRASQVADAAHARDHGIGVDLEPTGTSTKARSAARGCGSVRPGSCADVVADGEDVDVEGARPPAHLTGAARGLGLVRAAPSRTARGCAAVSPTSTALGSRAARARRPARSRRPTRHRRRRRGAVPARSTAYRECGDAGRRGWRRGRQRHPAVTRRRTIVTVTSSNGTPTGASGLCTVTSTASTRGRRPGTASAMRCGEGLDQVERHAGRRSRDDLRPRPSP